MSKIFKFDYNNNVVISFGDTDEIKEFVLCFRGTSRIPDLEETDDIGGFIQEHTHKVTYEEYLSEHLSDMARGDKTYDISDRFEVFDEDGDISFQLWDLIETIFMFEDTQSSFTFHMNLFKNQSFHVSFKNNELSITYETDDFWGKIPSWVACLKHFLTVTTDLTVTIN